MGWRGQLALGLTVIPTALGALAEPARADERVECAAAYERTQRSQQKAELISALESAERCAKPTCPALLRDECIKWVTDVRHKLPGLVVRVKAADGCQRDAAKVDVTGATRKDPDSDTLFVDPGLHEVKVTDPVSSKEKMQTIDFAPGERRDIDVDFSTPDVVCGGAKSKVAAAASPYLITKIPRTTLMIGSVGGGLVLLGAVLGVVGVVKRGDLDECKPSCSQDRIDGVRPFFIAGDVIAGLGLVTLAVAGVTFFALDPSFGTPSTSTSRFPFRF